MKKEYCENCERIVEYKTAKRQKIKLVNNKEIAYEEVYNICNECGGEFYTPEAHDINIYTYGEIARKMNGIITVEEISQILEKYDIGKKPLALLLGWGETTIIRYLDGQIPERVYSDVLKKILDDPNEMQIYIEKSKDLLTDLAYRKIIGRMAEIKLIEDSSKIYLISKHIIAKTCDITPLALQKILYFIQGFSQPLIGEFIFNDKCEAWVHGPVYREIYNRFCYYSCNPIDSNEFLEYGEIKELSEKEKDLIEAIIKFFGCYSGKVLEKITHETSPWKEARKGLLPDESSNKEISQPEIIEFFSKIKKQYNIEKIDNISNYSFKVFEEIKDTI